MNQNEIWMKTQNTDLKESLKAVCWLRLDMPYLKPLSTFAVLRNILQECGT